MNQKPYSSIDAPARCAIEIFIGRLHVRDYVVKNLLVYGPRATGGSGHKTRNANLAVIIERSRGMQFMSVQIEMADLALDSMIETGVLLQPLPIFENEWSEKDSHLNPGLLRHVEAEGIVVPLPSANDIVLKDRSG